MNGVGGMIVLITAIGFLFVIAIALIADTDLRSRYEDDDERDDEPPDDDYWWD